MRIDTLSPATKARIQREIEYRDRIKADLEGKPEHLLRHQWGLDRLREIEATNRTIEQLLRPE